MLTPLRTIGDPDHVDRFVSAFQNQQRHPHPRSRRLGSNMFSVYHLQDGRVYGVTLGKIIHVYEYNEFMQGVRDGDAPGYVSYETMSFTTDRWVFTQDELDRKGAGCRADDEFVATIVGDDSVLVTRSGAPTNSYADGTTGVSTYVRELVEAEEEYTEPDTTEIADTWKDVEVYQDGSLKQILPDD
jgi:hypothetical protein